MTESAGSALGPAHDSAADTTADAESASWRRRDGALVWHGFTPMDGYGSGEGLVIERAEGRELIDVDGRRYLDAISSLWVTTLGHRVPELDQAVRNQLDRVAHSTSLGHGSRVVVELAEALARVVPVPDPHFFFASDGSSAVEAAAKMAFEYWTLLGQPRRQRFLTLGGAYHGDTIGSLSLGDDGLGASVFDRLRFDVVRAPQPGSPGALASAAEMVRVMADELAAVVIEPLVQGAAGMRTAPASEYQSLGRACAEMGVLLICDEVATGFGRTGTLFASQQCHLQPDILCLGKGLTGGYLPMSAAVASGRVFDAYRGHTFFHGHSYGGNPLAAAVALAHLKLVVDGAALENVAHRSEQLRRLLSDRVGRPFRLVGLMGGVDALPGTGRAVCAEAVRRGVLLRPLGDVVVLMPPLTVTSDEIDRIVDVLAASLAAAGS